MIHLRDRRDRALSAAARDALFDGHRWRDASDQVHIRLLHLLNKRAGIDGHTVQEASLAFCEDEVKGER